jgi:hypothetical protein
MTCPRVRFQGPHGPIEFVGLADVFEAEVGERVTVLHQPGDLDDLRIDTLSQLFPAPLILGMVAAPLLGVGGVVIVVSRTRRRRRTRALTLGTRVQAEVVSIERKTHIEINDVHPWVLTAVYRDRGGTVTFTSHMLFEDPSPLHPIGSTVTVFHVPGEPKTYSIELDEPNTPVDT